MDAPAVDALALAALGSYAVQKLKLSKNAALKWISTSHPWMVRLAAALAAAAAAVGMTYSYADDGTLTITGFTLMNALMFVWTAGKQFILQEGFFRATKGLTKEGKK